MPRRRPARARVCAVVLAACPAVACADPSPPSSALPLAGSTATTRPPGPDDGSLPASRPVREPSVRLSVDGELTATDNAMSTADDQKRADLLAIIRPRAQWRHAGPALSVAVDASLAMVGSMRGLQPDTVRPDLDASAKATLVEHWLYLDAAARVQQTQADPFGPRVQDTSSSNRRIEQSVEASPSIRHRVTRDLTVQLRRDDGITWHATGTDVTRYTHETELRMDLDPVPLGGSASLSRQDGGDSGVPLSTLTVETARLGAKLAAAGSELVLSAEGGRDRVRTALTDHDDPMAAVGVQWRPSARTDVSGSLEQRFFGKGGRFTLSHRTPWMRVTLDVQREPMLASESLSSLSGLAGGNGVDLHSALDAVLTTRYPDPTVRAGVVDALLAGQGLGSGSFGPADVLANYPQLVTQSILTWAWFASRTTYSVSAWSRTAEVLRRHGDPLTSLPGFGSDDRQAGGTLQVQHKLSPTLSIDGLAQVSRITGLGSQAAQRSTDRTFRLSLSQGLSARATATVGAQVERFTATTPGQPGFSATLAFIGVSERF